MEVDAGELFKKLKAMKSSPTEVSPGPPRGATDGKVWTDIKGMHIRLVDMDETYLSNAIGFVKKGIQSRKESLAFLEAEVSRRAAIELQKAKDARRMSPLAATTTRFIREDDE